MSGIGNYFKALWAAQTWKAIAYLFLSFPVSLVLFIYAVTMYSLGLGLVILWVGIPILIAMQLSLRPIGTFERGLINLFSEAKLEGPAPMPPPTGLKGFANWRVVALAKDAHSWRVAAWIMVRGVLGSINFVVALCAAIIPIAVVLATVYAAALVAGLDWGTDIEDHTYAPWVLLGAPVALSAMPLFAWAARGLGYVNGKLARWALGPCGSEREEQLAARAQLAEEKLRIDQELHDSIGHMITMTIVQAGAGAHVFDSDPEFARQALKNIEERGRSAMGELDRIISAIRGDEPETRAPLPGIADIQTLVDSSRAAGIDVTAVIEPPQVPPAFGRAAYGIVREALTNAARHAPGASVEVVVQQDRDALAIEIVNGPTPTPGAARAREGGTGHGLSGIRDRVGLLGGRSTIGTTSDGGFRVAALLPLETTLAPEGEETSRWAGLRATVGA